MKGIRQKLLNILKITENKYKVVAKNSDTKIYNEKGEQLTVANKIESLLNVKRVIPKIRKKKTKFIQM